MSGSVARVISGLIRLPALFTSDPAAGRRFVEFFTANIRNAHTRKAYARAAVEFAACCDLNDLRELRRIEPVHLAAYIEGPRPTWRHPRSSDTWQPVGCCSIGW